MFAVTQSGSSQSDPSTVIGFSQPTFDQDLADARTELLDLIQQYRCHSLTLDLAGLRDIPSGLLGLLMEVHLRGTSIRLWNPSRELCEVLEITRLNRLFPVGRGDAGASCSLNSIHSLQ